MRLACSLLFALALSACGGGVRWQKDGADEALLTGDLSACRKQAQALYGGAAAMVPGGSSIDPRFGPGGPTPADNLMQQEQSAGACMRAKGYTLGSGEKKKARPAAPSLR